MLVTLSTGEHAAQNGTNAGPALRIGLVNMPFAAADRPSIQCGLLASILSRAGHATTTHHLNLRFADRVGGKLYSDFADNRWLIFLGEWLFAQEAFGVETCKETYFRECKVAEHQHRLGLSLSDLADLRENVIPEFLDDCIAATPWKDYDLAGFTCTFDQQVPSFALARRIKDRFPRVKTVFGGATFDRDNASEFVKKLPWVDYIIVGEADRSIVSLASALSARTPMANIPGLACKERAAAEFCEPEVVRDLMDMPDPDYTEYFEAIGGAGNKLARARSIQVPFQGARGCWWGAKHHCTFCSLKDEEMVYRSRPPEHVANEIIRQSSRYRELHFTAVDSILDMHYIDGLFPILERHGIDAAFFYEVKANLNRQQLARLAHGGVKQAQPGIESLSTRMLNIMKKGTTKLLNLRFLKWARYYGIVPGWNILTGFPGEELDYYHEQIDLIPSIVHLQPPSGADNIMLEKHAPYMVANNPWYKNRKPLDSYRYLFPPNLIDIDKIALYFDAQPEYPAGVPMALTRLQDAIKIWQNAWQRVPRPSLTYQRGADWSRIIDSRTTQPPSEYLLNHTETAVMEACGDTAATIPNILCYLTDTEHVTASEQDVRTICAELLEKRLLVHDDNRYFCLALPVKRGW